MADHDDHTTDDNPFHLPSPSGVPIVTGFGIALMLFGFVPDARIWRLSLVSLGATITLGCLFTWIRDSVREFNDLPD